MERIWVDQSGPPNTQNDAKNCLTTDPEPFASFGVFGGYFMVLSVLSVQSLVASFSGNWCRFVVTSCFSSQSFWKAGSARNGSQIGSSLRRADVTGVP